MQTISLKYELYFFGALLAITKQERDALLSNYRTVIKYAASADTQGMQYGTFIIKGEAAKTFLATFCVPYISAPGARIFKILVSTPHNTQGVLWGIDTKNFKIPAPGAEI